MTDTPVAGGSNPGGTTSKGRSDGDKTAEAHLEWIVFENTTVFNDLQILQFQKTNRGSYFFIGPNQSGKTSVFELIRRCLGSEKNTSLSSSFNKENTSAVICSYKLGGDKHMISALFAIPSSTEKDYVPHVKIACELVGGEITQFGVDTVSSGFQSQKFECPADLSKSLICSIKDLSKDLKKPIGSDGKARIKKHINGLKGYLVSEVQPPTKTTVKAESKTKTVCDNILESINSKVVHIFSSRAIGTLQWSESERVELKYREDNYKSASDSAEILRWYEHQRHTNKLNDLEIQREKKYFKILTDGSDMDFYLEQPGEKGKEQLKVKTQQRTCDLLKVSEGILEAKICSIMLAVDRFTTILFEDPDRGMHPQMIHRLRDRILREISDKTILITTHHPAFTAYWNLDRIFLFRRDTSPQTNPSFVVNMVPKELTTGSSNSSRFISNWEYSTIFYATRILFVEGESDQLFLSELKYLMETEKGSGSREILPELTEEDYEQFLHFLNGLEVMNVGGKGNLPTMADICKKLAIEWLTLVDDDETKTPQLSIEQVRKHKSRKTNKKATRVDTNEQTPEQEFKWSCGDLEDVVITFANDHRLKRPRRVCPRCENGNRKTHSVMRESAIKLVGKEYIRGVLKKTQKIPCSARLHMRDFLKAALKILCSEKNTADEHDIVKFVRFLSRCAQKVKVVRLAPMKRKILATKRETPPMKKETPMKRRTPPMKKKTHRQ